MGFGSPPFFSDGLPMIWLDFETRSRCDLKTSGVYNYAQDASTQVLCMSYAVDDGDVQTWTRGPLPDFTGHMIYAHNAAFERLIFQYVLDRPTPPERFVCTAAQARSNCLPGSLEDIGRAMSSKMRKDFRGSQLIRKMCVPPFQHTPALMDELIRYCAQDVRTMRAVSKAMRSLSAEELADYHVNERINDRGVLLDLPLAQAAMRYARAEQADIQTLVMELTDGAISSVRSPRMREWVLDRLGPEARKVMWTDDKYSIDKNVRAVLIERDDIPLHVADVIQCADDLWASSVAKFKRLASLADEDDRRVRGAFVFAGGGATGRASSYGAQVHNFTRKCAKEPEVVRNVMVANGPIVPRFGGHVTKVLKGMLRPALIPAHGKQFIVADWVGIEARMNPWLSDNASEVLNVFRTGQDIYVREAKKIFNTQEITPEQRQVGKVAVLACGYGGGHGAFAMMAKTYGIQKTEDEARKLVTKWRHANQWAVNYWSELEMAYLSAMKHPGQDFKAARVIYNYDGTHLWYDLPSGRRLCYPFARLNGDVVSYLKSSWKPGAGAVEWPRHTLWKGLACENICQASANDILRHALRGLDDVVLHIHDEIVVECAEDRVEEMRRVMCTPPAWAEGLPLDVEIKIMSRYGK